ncbi:MAG: ABC transporter permease, partial [Deltaproteobacteria bacterium]
VFYQKWDWALITFMIFPISIIPIVKFGKKIRKFSKKSQIKMGSITTLLHETISGNRIVKAFNMEDYESKRFSEENHRLFKIIMKRQTIRALSSPVMETLGGLGAALIILVGGMAVIKGKVTPGTFFSFVTALFMMYQPLKSISKMNNIIQEGMAAGKRVFEILDLKPGIHDKEGAIHLSGIKEGIEFKNVSFKYEDEWVLKDISFKVRKGETVALVGMSGGGKTTIANLIPRFYDIQHGTILIDGVDIRDYTIRSLRDNIAIVTQQTILFNDTVRNNIAYGNHEKNDEEVIKAAIAANAHDFILKLPKGYNTIIGEAGIKLSGGERQRISIARALLKDAPILILDEATSSLDTESEKEVQIALNNLMKNRTSIVIAHRLSTIRNADKIIVIENGKIVEKGTHEELLALKGYYKKLYDLQFVTQEKDSFENIVEKEMPRF